MVIHTNSHRPQKCGKIIYAQTGVFCGEKWVNVGENSNLDKNLGHLMSFFGEYPSTVDNKSRFVFPAALKKQYPEGMTKFVISRGLDNCLMLYTLEMWENVEAGLKALKDSDLKVRLFKTLLLGGATEVEVDSGNRLTIPPTLKAHAKIDKDIILAPYIDKVKIWDAATYQKFLDEAAAQFDTLAKDLNVEF